RTRPPGAPGGAVAVAPAEARGLVERFFDLLEANADELWQVPTLDTPEAPEDEADDDDVFEAAYEGVTFEGSGGDAEQGGIDEGQPRRPFDLEADAERLERRLR